MSVKVHRYYIAPITTTEDILSAMSCYMLCCEGHRSAIKHPRSKAEAEVMCYGDKATLESIVERLNKTQPLPRWKQ